jgi:hypothetical protein
MAAMVSYVRTASTRGHCKASLQNGWGEVRLLSEEPKARSLLGNHSAPSAPAMPSQLQCFD